MATLGCAPRPCPGALEAVLVEAGQAPRRLGRSRDAAFMALDGDAELAVVGRWRARGGELGRVELSSYELEADRLRSKRALPRGAMGRSAIVIGDEGDWLARRAGDSLRIERVDDGALELERDGLGSILAGGRTRLLWTDLEGRMRLWAREREDGSWRELASGPAPRARQVDVQRGAFILGEGELMIVQERVDVVSGAQTHALVVREGDRLRVLPERLETLGLARVDASRAAGVFEGRYCEWTLGAPGEGLGPPECSWQWRFDAGVRFGVGDALWVWQGSELEIVERSTGAVLDTLTMPSCATISAVVVRGDRALIGLAARP
ncbi:hypothetical protein G6O69_11040 [Pseudenhygromyxa sp. WMMC2535]|uniref:hypothetical protein n=1 Tax=Pseudenhygromyxa sp. WMMC2535 TaxID=2712867 RepID=UPI001552A047|nr:hypothetical protein [Pseudenhygromyxa sp. WMMC2535]NVB38366.1 hypothetical protein [Pseudenhygromyxa sp. WMMC2535]